MYLIVFVTTPSEKVAVKIGRAVVKQKLAACVNIIPKIRSLYTWQGKFYDEREALMILKTRRSYFPKLARAIKKLHPYEVPEIIGLKIDRGYKPYLKWLLTNTRPAR
ncbi:MAG: divalent-cation tolerance protein CutA [Planctomycetota bacterium]